MQEKQTFNAEYIGENNDNQKFATNPAPILEEPFFGQPIELQSLPQPINTKICMQFKCPQCQKAFNNNELTTPIVPQTLPPDPYHQQKRVYEDYSRLFPECNCCFFFIFFIFLIALCVVSFNMGSINIAAGIIYIISDFNFSVGVIFGQYAVVNNEEKYLIHYQVFVGISLLAQTIAFIITIMSYTIKSEETSTNGTDTFILVVSILSFVIYLSVGGFLLIYGRKIRVRLIELILTKKKFPKNLPLPKEIQPLEEKIE